MKPPRDSDGDKFNYQCLDDHINTCLKLLLQGCFTSNYLKSQLYFQYFALFES